MSDARDPPADQVHPATDLEPAAANDGVHHEGEEEMMLDEATMAALGGDMTMDDVDMLNAIHAAAEAAETAPAEHDGQENLGEPQGLSAEEAQVASDISALLQSLAEQDEQHLSGDHTAVSVADGSMHESVGNVNMLDLGMEMDMDMDADEVQADQEALLAAVRALEDMDAEHDMVGMGDMALLDGAGSADLGAGIVEEAEATISPSTEDGNLPEATLAQKLDQQSQMAALLSSTPAATTELSAAPQPMAATDSAAPAIAETFAAPNATSPLLSRMGVPVDGTEPVTAIPRQPSATQPISVPRTGQVQAPPNVTRTTTPPGSPPPTAFFARRRLAPPLHSRAGIVPRQDIFGPGILPPSLGSTPPTINAVVPPPAMPPPAPAQAVPSAPPKGDVGLQTFVPPGNAATEPSSLISHSGILPAASIAPPTTAAPVAASAAAARSPAHTSAAAPIPPAEGLQPASRPPAAAPAPGKPSAPVQPVAAKTSAASASSTTAASAPAAASANQTDESLLDPMLFGDSEGFDPDTLANLAALSRIANEEDDEPVEVPAGEGAGAAREGLAPPTEDQAKKRRKSRAQEPQLSRDQVRALVEGLGKGGKGRRASEEEAGDKEKEKDEDKTDDEQGVAATKEEELRSKEEQLTEIGEVDREDLKDAEYKEEGEEDTSSKGKRKRKRNRMTLSCTECHRRCDRNIPCSRCVARGVAGMCKMEYPNLPPPKKRRAPPQLPINHELGLRVQALETLLRSGSNMDSGAAKLAAKETIMQATKAAKSGNLDAGNALASLTLAAGGDMSKMEATEQSGLLMEVLQQLSSASMARVEQEEEEIPEATDDPWSTVPEAAVESSNARNLQGPGQGEHAEPYTNLSVPGFREDNGNIFVPPTVRYIEKAMRTENILSKEPLSIQGDPRFLAAATKFAYGADAPAIKKDLVASIQSISLTGALRIASAFLARFPPTPGPRSIYVPDPLSWEDEMAIKSAGPGLEVKQMRFLDARGLGVDWDGMRQDLLQATPGSAVVLYVGGSMPSGAELSASLWRLLALILIEKQLIPLCILAFQGLASGEPGRDAQPMRFMVHEGLPVLLVQSFDSNMGVHADSPSVVSLVTQSAQVKQRVESQFRSIARGMYLHPSPWGAHVVQAVLNSPRLYPAWLNELKAMAERLRSVRDRLYDVIVNKLKTPGSWLHIKRAHGMYCSTMLSPSQIRDLADKKNIHLLPDGSVSLGSLNVARIDTLARAIDWAVQNSIKEAEIARERAVAVEAALKAAREAAAKEQAEAAARAAKEAADRAREEDAALMEQSIAEAMMRQAVEAQEMEHEDDRRDLDEAIEKAKQSAEIQRRAEEILASIGQ